MFVINGVGIIDWRTKLLSAKMLTWITLARLNEPDFNYIESGYSLSKEERAFLSEKSNKMLLREFGQDRVKKKDGFEARFYLIPYKKSFALKEDIGDISILADGSYELKINHLNVSLEEFLSFSSLPDYFIPALSQLAKSRKWEINCELNSDFDAFSIGKINLLIKMKEPIRNPVAFIKGLVRKINDFIKKNTRV